MAACKLIVHADDFGLSEEVNDGIVLAHRRGIVTSTSIMAMGQAFDHALNLTKANPSLDLGIHLTLVGEKPVLHKEVVPSLVDSAGLFFDSAQVFMKRYILGAVSMHEVTLELEAQIGTILSHGIKVTHLDAHQHLHMVPAIRRVVGDLALKYGIPAIRYPRERFQSYMLGTGGSFKRLVQLLILNTFCSLCTVGGVRKTDYFYGFYMGGRLSKTSLIKILRALPATGTCELMCHPGLAPSNSKYRSWGYNWQKEYDALIDDEIVRYLRAHDIQLVSYTDFLNSNFMD